MASTEESWLPDEENERGDTTEDAVPENDSVKDAPPDGGTSDKTPPVSVTIESEDNSANPTETKDDENKEKSMIKDSTEHLSPESENPSDDKSKTGDAHDVNNENENDKETNDVDVALEASDDEEEAAVNVIVKDRPMTVESSRTLSHKNHIVEAAVVQETHPLTAVPAAAVLKVGSKSGVDISDPGNINGVSSIDFNIAALNEEDKPWKKPGADITDYFNYGFTEETWLAYSEQQRILRAQFGGMPLTSVTNSNVKVVSNIGAMGGGTGQAFRSIGLMGRAHQTGGGGGGGSIGVIGSGIRDLRRRDVGHVSNSHSHSVSATGMSIPTAGGAGAYAPPNPVPAPSPALNQHPTATFHPSVVGPSSGNTNFSVPPPSFHVPPPGLPPTYLHPAMAAVNFAPHDIFTVPPPAGSLSQVPWDGPGGLPRGPPGAGHQVHRERTPDSIRSEEEAKLAETQAEMLEREIRNDHRRGGPGSQSSYRDHHRERDRDRDRERDRDRDRNRDRERVARSPRPSDRDYSRSDRSSARYDREHIRDRDHHRDRYRSRSRSRSRDRKYASRNKRPRFGEDEARYGGGSAASGGTSRRHASKRSRRSRSRSQVSPGGPQGGNAARSRHRSRGGETSPVSSSRRRGGATEAVGQSRGGSSPGGNGGEGELGASSTGLAE